MLICFYLVLYFIIHLNGGIIKATTQKTKSVYLYIRGKEARIYFCEYFKVYSILRKEEWMNALCAFINVDIEIQVFIQKIKHTHTHLILFWLSASFSPIIMEIYIQCF